MAARMNALQGLGLGLACAAATAIAGPAAALTCPVAHARAGRNTIQQSEADIRRLSEVFSKRGEAAAPDLVAATRAAHPHATTGAIVNYLMAGFCPVVARDARLSEAQKKARVRDFASIVNRAAYKR